MGFICVPLPMVINSFIICTYQKTHRKPKQKQATSQEMRDAVT